MKRGEVAYREANETVGFVFDVIFEVEVILLGRESGDQGGGKERENLPHDRVFLVERETILVVAAGAGGAEAVVEKLGDKVCIRSIVP